MPVTDTFFKKYLSIYLFFGCTGSLLLRRLSLVSSCRRYSLISLHGFLIVVAALVADHKLQGTRLCFQLGRSRAQAQELHNTGLATPRHMGSSRTRDRTCVPHLGRQILNHWATREVVYLTIWRALK